MDSHERNNYEQNTTGDRVAATDREIRVQAAPTEQHATHATRLHGRSRNPLAWLLPLLLLGLAAGAAFWLINRNERDRVGDPVAVGTSGRGGDSLRALEPGAEVNLSQITIRDVVGDRTFWVGEGSERALVVIPEDSQGGREIRERFARGQEVNIAGRVAEAGHVPDGLDEQDRSAVRNANGRVILARTARQISQ